MGIMVAKITKEFEGEEWQNTYCIGTDTIPLASPHFVDADVDKITTSAPFLEGNTNINDPGYIPPLSILHALVAFERAFHAQVVRFTRINISDAVHGTPNQLTIALDLNGLGTPASADALAPGAISLMVPKNAFGVTGKAGRAFYRGCLLDSDVSMRGFKLVGLAPGNAIELSFDNAYVGSQLGTFFNSGLITAVPRLMIGKFRSQKWPVVLERGDLYGASIWVGWGALSAKSRQVKKGRKRTPNP